jgi:hypothetical protein
MRLAALALATFGLGLAVAGSAAAASQATDLDFLKANRCKGLAVGLGADPAALTSYIKTQEGARLDVILQRGDEEFTRAKRQTKDANIKDRLAAELAGPCTAYTGGQAMAAGANATNVSAH